REELVAQLARFARTPATQKLLAEHARNLGAPTAGRAVALRAMARAGLGETPRVWLDALGEVLAGEDRELLAEAVAAARALPPPKKGADPLAAPLRTVSRDSALPAQVRLTALAARPGGSALEPALLTFVRSHLDPAQPVALRSLAVDALSKV